MAAATKGDDSYNGDKKRRQSDPDTNAQSDLVGSLGEHFR